MRSPVRHPQGIDFAEFKSEMMLRSPLLIRKLHFSDLAGKSGSIPTDIAVIVPLVLRVNNRADIGMHGIEKAERKANDQSNFRAIGKSFAQSVLNDQVITRRA